MREILDQITLGVLESLEQHSEVTDVRMMDQEPAEPLVIDAWEQKYMCKLPAELKNFYQMTNGILIQWSITFKGGIIQLGRIEVNPLASLKRLAVSTAGKGFNEPSFLDIESEEDEFDEEGRSIPHFDERNRIYELDGCSGNGKVCLVYKELKAGFTISKPEIWFLDRSLRWWFLSGNFVNYFRMMMIHLGLPNWQYIFTDHGLSPEAKFWFSLYAPDRLSAQSTIQPASIDEDAGSITGSKINPQRLFSRKSDKKKSVNDQSKAKNPGIASRSRIWSQKQLKSSLRSNQR